MAALPRPFQVCACCGRVRIWHELEFTGPAEKRGRADFGDVVLQMRQCGACPGTMAREIQDESEDEGPPSRRAA